MLPEATGNILFQLVLDFDNDFSYEIRDNCPGTCNPDQKDSDADGIDDLCDSTPKGYR